MYKYVQSRPEDPKYSKSPDSPINDSNKKFDEPRFEDSVFFVVYNYCSWCFVYFEFWNARFTLPPLAFAGKGFER